MGEPTAILVVDDDPLILSIAERVLREKGYDVATAATGEAALRLAQEQKPALVLLDVLLPDANGVEVGRQIKVAAEGSPPFVILVSGVKTAPDDQAFGLESGADGYIGRPVSNRELLARMEAALRLKRAEEALAERTKELEAANERLKAEVAERKRAEQALRENEARLVQQERLAAVGQFTTGLAHGVNNILQGILLRVEMTLADSSLSPAAQQSLEEILEETKRVARLVQKLLDFSGKAILRRREVDLDDLVRRQVERMRPTFPRGVSVTVRSAADAVVRADARQLRQLVANLVENAADAMPDGGEVDVVLQRGPAGATCAICHQRVDGEWVHLVVADGGEGIAPDEAPHIFEPFFTTRAPERSGLGLSQALGIVKQHRGHIEVESETGRGTQFTAFLPPYSKGD